MATIVRTLTGQDTLEIGEQVSVSWISDNMPGADIPGHGDHPTTVYTGIINGWHTFQCGCRDILYVPVHPVR